VLEIARDKLISSFVGYKQNRKIKEREREKKSECEIALGSCEITRMNQMLRGPLCYFD
jgi:hypothetical protein